MIKKGKDRGSFLGYPGPAMPNYGSPEEEELALGDSLQLTPTEA